jgi:hypothetical protein
MVAMQGPVKAYRLFIPSFIKNILKLSLLCNFIHKAFALGFTKFPLDKRNFKLDFLTVLIKLSDIKWRLIVKLYKCNCIAESTQFYYANTSCSNLFGNIPSRVIRTRNIRRIISSVCCNAVILAPKRWRRHLRSVSEVNLGGERLASHSSRFIPHKRAPGIKWRGGSVGPRPVWTRWHRKRSLYLPGIKPRLSRSSQSLYWLSYHKPADLETTRRIFSAALYAVQFSPD